MITKFGSFKASRIENEHLSDIIAGLSDKPIPLPHGVQKSLDDFSKDEIGSPLQDEFLLLSKFAPVDNNVIYVCQNQEDPEVMEAMIVSGDHDVHILLRRFISDSLLLIRNLRTVVVDQIIEPIVMVYDSLMEGEPEAFSIEADQLMTDEEDDKVLGEMAGLPQDFDEGHFGVGAVEYDEDRGIPGQADLFEDRLI